MRPFLTRPKASFHCVDSSFFSYSNHMVSSLSKLINACSSIQEKSSMYETYAKDSDTALQVLLHIVSLNEDYYSTFKHSFQIIYTLRKESFSYHKLSKLYSIAQAHRCELSFILHDLQAPQFRGLMNTYGANIHMVIQDSTFSQLSYFVTSLESIIHHDFTTQSGIEKYLQTTLTYHQKDLSKESFIILKQAQAQWYTKLNFLTMKMPTHTLMIEDWSVSLLNKDEVALYQKKNFYQLYQNIHSSPYFLFVWNNSQGVFIWTHSYKKAILSYTTDQARSLRFEDESNTTVDLLIHHWVYKKIYIRGSDEDISRWYDTTKSYDDSDQDYRVNSFFESESWLSEISHLMTSHQDLIFRSPTTWTALVEWVSWSWKTNLIFHRIDYLLQELPDQFQANNLMVFTPNEILASYMQASLSSTSFTFKDSLRIVSFDSVVSLPHPKSCSYKPADSTCFTHEIKTISSSIYAHYEDSKWELYSMVYEQITSTLHLLQKTHISKSSIEQHVHLNWYNTDLSLLNQSLKNLQKIKNTYYTLPSTFIEELLHSIHTSWHITYTTGSDSISIKQRYHEELFESSRSIIQQSIADYQKTLLSQWIAIDSNQLVVKNYSQQFQELTARLNDQENFLLRELVTTSLYQYIGKTITYPSYQYVLIDEFQDFHPLALMVLNKLYGSSMILSGDFMQSARYHSKDDLKALWIQLVDHRTMRDNFRNTLETIQYAHSIFGEEVDSLFLARRVIKRWPHPLVVDDAPITALIKKINSLVTTLNPKETIAIIYYDIEYAKTLYNQFTTQSTNHVLFPSLDTEHYQELISWYYSQQLYFISYRESKGLEFDHVILIDQKTLLDSNLDYKKKLWYIGCTRAVKTLSVFN